MKYLQFRKRWHMGQGFNSTIRQLIFALPLMMGMIEFVLRVAMHQADKIEFFPVSPVVVGIGLCVALMAISAAPDAPATGKLLSEIPANGARVGNHNWEEFVAKLGIWMAVLGVAGWVYLLTASFSDEVKAIIPYYPLTGALVYYGLGIGLTEWKART
jgi:hypothetical protein